MKQIFCLFDKKAECQLDVFESPNAATAIRKCEMDMKSDQHLHDYAEDFSLMLLGAHCPINGLEALPPTTVIELSVIRQAPDAPSPSPRQ